MYACHIIWTCACMHAWMIANCCTSNVADPVEPSQQTMQQQTAKQQGMFVLCIHISCSTGGCIKIMHRIQLSLVMLLELWLWINRQWNKDITMPHTKKMKVNLHATHNLLVMKPSWCTTIAGHACMHEYAFTVKMECPIRTLGSSTITVIKECLNSCGCRAPQGCCGTPHFLQYCH